MLGTMCCLGLGMQLLQLLRGLCLLLLGQNHRTGMHDIWRLELLLLLLLLLNSCFRSSCGGGGLLLQLGLLQSCLLPSKLETKGQSFGVMVYGTRLLLSRWNLEQQMHLRYSVRVNVEHKLGLLAVGSGRTGRSTGCGRMLQGRRTRSGCGCLRGEE